MNAATTPATGRTDQLGRDEGLGSWFVSTDHGRISTMFLGWTLGAFLLGALLSLWLSLKSASGEAEDTGFLFQISAHRLVLHLGQFDRVLQPLHRRIPHRDARFQP